MENYVIAHCIAGIGNRIASLVGAWHLAKKLNYNLRVNWNCDEDCMACFNDLFKFKQNKNFSFLKQKTRKSIFLHPHTLKLENPLKGVIPNTKTRYISCEKNLEQYSIIVYQNYEIPKEITQAQITECLTYFGINSYVARKARRFIKKYKINTDVHGLHIRGTDCPTKQEIQRYYNIISRNPNQRFFVCSDDKSFENICTRLPNALSYKKRSYVNYDPNIKKLYRDRKSVQDAFIDMLILSRTGKCDDESLYRAMYSISTFFSVSTLYKNVDFKKSVKFWNKFPLLTKLLS